MSSHVLVAMDDSPMAERALEHALEEHPGADVTVLHVISFESVAYAPTGAGDGPALDPNWREEGEQRAEALFDRAREIAGREIETVTVVGRPDRAIVEYAEDHDVDHLIVGSHARTGVERLILGSTAELVVRRSPVPVTIIR